MCCSCSSSPANTRPRTPVRSAATVSAMAKALVASSSTGRSGCSLCSASTSLMLARGWPSWHSTRSGVPRRMPSSRSSRSVTQAARTGRPALRRWLSMRLAISSPALSTSSFEVLACSVIGVLRVGRHHQLSGVLDCAPGSSRTRRGTRYRAGGGSGAHEFARSGLRHVVMGGAADAVEHMEIVGQNPALKQPGRQIDQCVSRIVYAAEQHGLVEQRRAGLRQAAQRIPNRLVQLLGVVAWTTTTFCRRPRPSQASSASSTRSGSTIGWRVDAEALHVRQELERLGQRRRA